MNRQAVILIHGIGEQMPMQTLRGFVDAVWLRDSSLVHPSLPKRVLSKPDPTTGNIATPLLRTNPRISGCQTDFYEFYWAHLVKGTKLSDTLAWFQVLVLRNPWDLPPRLFWIWLFIISSTSAVVALLIYYFEIFTPDFWTSPLNWFGTPLGLILAAVANSLLVGILGDAARYLHHTPQNVGSRIDILEKGVELLQKIQDSGRYDRVILVGHSLGSVIGYDILTYAWALQNNQYNERVAPTQEALKYLEGLSDEYLSENLVDVDQFQCAQRHYHREQLEMGSNWLVTDFITLGSPLTYAAVLLSKNLAQLRQRIQEREYPSCPPQLENGRFTYGIDFPSSSPPGGRYRRFLPNHGALFGPTRWTNIYFREDLVAGPLQNVFGPGIRDIAVRTGRAFLKPVSHVLYWSAPEALDVLRAALDLADTTESGR